MTSVLTPSQLDELQALRAILGAGDVVGEDVSGDGEDEQGSGDDDGPVTIFVDGEDVTVIVILDVAPNARSGVPIHLERAGEAVGVCGAVEHLPPVRLEACYKTFRYLSLPIRATAAMNDTATDASIGFTISGCWLVGKAAGIKAELEEELGALVSSADPLEPLIWTACMLVRDVLERVDALVYSAEDPLKMHRFLLAFNLRRRNELFKDQSHECGVCFDIKDGARFVRFECGHAFCGECCRGLVRSTVSGGQIHVKCPHTDCRELLQPHEIKKIVDDDDLFERWTELTFKHAIANDPDFTHCPRCGGVAIEDADDCSADCSLCNFVFCTLCTEARHPGVQCVSAEGKLRMLREKAAGGSAEALAALRRKELELASVSLIEKTSKACPSCGEGVQKSEGCNKMTCLCGTTWCWRCGRQVNGYDHFKEKDGCVLFDDSEVLRWEREFQGLMMMFGGGRRGEFPGLRGLGDDGDDGDDVIQQEEVGPARRHDRNARNARNARGRHDVSVSCPCCAQTSYRHGGNHIRCWSCRNWFCGYCRQLLPKRGRAHFKPTGSCPQHKE